MKKELLMATALVSTLGAASVAQAVTATMSGSMKIGVEVDSPDGNSAVDTQNVVDLSNFSVSLSETTDGGTTISSSFGVIDEGANDIGDDDNSLKLTFTDGSALEVLNAGNALGTHDIAVPGAAGEMGVAGTSTNSAPTGLDFAGPSTPLGVEWHSASDFLMDGLKVSASFSTDSGAAKAATSRTESSWGLGATYVTSAGDTAITIGGGLSGSEVAVLNTQSNADDGGFTVGVSAVTGDLTVAVGFADGDTTTGVGSNTNKQVDGDVVKAGVKYVTGDITMNVGFVNGTAVDNIFGGTNTAEDSHEEVNASVTYAVASGVSAILGYTSVDKSDENAASGGTGGSSWYIGATMSF
ncbi:porin [Alphaproteobacteria bacterium]|nr:porin [Alphaproteobacteria bacterium]